MTIIADKCYNSSMNMKSYSFTDDALQAIREHFQARYEAKAISKRVSLRQTAYDLLPDGTIVKKYACGGETITMRIKTYYVEVEF